MEGVGHAAEETERVAFVTGGFQPADLLLGRADFTGELFLGQARFGAERGELEGHIPGWPGLTESLGERLIL